MWHSKEFFTNSVYSVLCFMFYQVDSVIQMKNESTYIDFRMKEKPGKSRARGMNQI